MMLLLPQFIRLSYTKPAYHTTKMIQAGRGLVREDLSMIDILDRVRNKDLQAKIVSAEEAAAFIKPGMNIGTSGFTASAYPKAVPMTTAVIINELAR